MSGLKTFLAGAFLIVASASASAADNAFLNRVVDCVGRMSAQMEHHWLLADQSTTIIEKQRSDLIDVLDALTTSENASRVLTGRINAKLAHASLLTRSAFSKDPKSSAWATRQAERSIAHCDQIALSAPVNDVIIVDLASDADAASSTKADEAWPASK